MAMKLTKEENYGIMALLDLAYNLGGGPIQVRQLAVRQDIPDRFLEQIFAKLRRAGIVSGKRGPNGGYRLIKQPKDIKLEDVIKTLQPKSKDNISGSEKSLASLIDIFWTEIQDTFDSTLRSFTLEDLCNRAEQKNVEPRGFQLDNVKLNTLELKTTDIDAAELSSLS